MTALILDCDGVLADTERDGHLVAFNETFVEFGLSARWSQEHYGRLLRIGGGKERLRTLRGSFPDDPGLPADPADDDDFIAELHRRKTRRFIDIVESGRLPARPGVARIIRSALDAGWSLAVASTSAEPSVRTVLRAVVGDDADRFAGVFAGDIVAAKKPAPDIYLAALRGLGARADDTLVIEDSAVGAAAASAAGLQTVITLSSYTIDEEFPDAAVVTTSLGDAGVDGGIRRSRLQLPLEWPIELPLLEAVAHSGRA